MSAKSDQVADAVTAESDLLPLGLLLGGTPSRSSPSELLDTTIAVANCARDSGYGYVVVGQHFLGYPFQHLSTIPFLARLAPETGRMRLATGVLLPPMLRPVDAAEQLATLDVITGGRLTVGIGAGYREEEFRAAGVDLDTRFARMLESIELYRKLWAGGAIEYAGEFYEVSAEGPSIMPVQVGGPPLWIAAMSRAGFARAIAHDAKPYLGPRVSETRVAHWVRQYREATGNPIATLPLRRDLYLGANRATAWTEAIAAFGARYDLYRARGLVRDTGTQAMEEAGLRESFIAGDAQEVGETLRRYLELGANPIILNIEWSSMARDEMLEMFRQVADTVR